MEKDYWIMHCLYGLAAQGFNFELKGGTLLSKGFGIIQRFSEDIDIRIDPARAPFPVFTAPGQTKKARHIESRKTFYDWLADTIQITGISDVARDHAFDDDKYQSGGIRLRYGSVLDNPANFQKAFFWKLASMTPRRTCPARLYISKWPCSRFVNIGAGRTSVLLMFIIIYCSRNVNNI
ncbi:MAG: nucleotidyl transferase AbiEii/AbiGii toxin family protein [Acidiferrobacterales bacterium]